MLKPFNVSAEWWTWTHRYFPVLFRREVFVLLCVRKRLPWMSRDVLTLLIRALAKAHGDMPKSVSWTVPTSVFSKPPLAWPYPVPPHHNEYFPPNDPLGLPWNGPAPNHHPFVPAYPPPPAPLAGFHHMHMG